MKEVRELEEFYPEIRSLKNLAVAPSLKSRPDAVLILAILKENSYILSETIQELIEYFTGCMNQKKVFVLNSADMDLLRRNGTMSENEYQELKQKNIDFEKFTKEEYEIHKDWFGTNKKQPEVSEQSSENPEPLKSNINEHATEDSKSKIVNDFAETFSFVEKSHFNPGKYLKKSADKRYDDKVSEEKCQSIIAKEFEWMTWEELEQRRKDLLHHFVQRGKGLKSRRTIGETMAIIKFLLDVNPLAKTSDEIKLSEDSQILINFRDKDGKTVLHRAATMGGGVIYWLLRLGANPLVKDIEKKAFLDYIPSNWSKTKKSAEGYVQLLKDES